mmetsp:Transcript_89461/g.163974  ORF Transcript_89461/g.163974 Transcript_89461/m.163974 type:complete len:251 (-) Transcript_89461:30-782(-)
MQPPTSLPERPGIDGPCKGESLQELAALRDEARATFEETGEFPDGRWQFHCHVRKTWVNVSDQEDADLKVGYLQLRQQPKITYKVNAVPFEIDFTLLRRKNLASQRLQELRYDGILPFDPPLAEPCADVAEGAAKDAAAGDDSAFAARRKTEAAGWSAEECRSRLAEALDGADAAAAQQELEEIVKLLDFSLSYQQCVELRLGKLAGRAQKELSADHPGVKEAADTVVKKIFRLAQGGTARLQSDVIVKN